MSIRSAVPCLLSVACLCAGAAALLHDHYPQDGGYGKKSAGGYNGGCQSGGGGQGSSLPDASSGAVGVPASTPRAPAAPAVTRAGTGAPTAVPAAGRGGAVTRGSPSPRTGASTSEGRAPTLSCAGRSFTAEAAPEAWWTWWELHRTQFLPSSVLTDDDSQPAAPAAYTLREASLRTVLPLLRELLSDRDAPTRAAAAVAYGRLAGDEAVDALLPLLEDSSLLVRERTILGLGATGSLRVAPTLLQLATDGRVTGGGPQGRVSPDAQPLALLALGLGRRHGLSETVDGFVAALARSDDRGAHNDRRTAALLYHTLAYLDDLGQFAREASLDPGAPTALRCRATESLALSEDPAVLTALDQRLHDGQLDLRRSAAIAMGSWSHPGVLAELTTHLVDESEELLRGFLLLSISAQGGEAAREFLVETLQQGDAASRPWAALALARLGRTEEDPIAREALRHAAANERSESARLALMLASGIARNPEAVPEMVARLRGSGSGRERALAAIALSLTADEAGKLALRERMAAERSDDVLAYLAEALSAYGDADDVPALSAVLTDGNTAHHALRCARALAEHGTPEAEQALIAAIEDRATPPVVRAAAIEALGLALDAHVGPVLIETAWYCNFDVLPSWLDAALVGSML
ncbi:MAG: HEAT repeat domain-containing protein [Planctomycetota bacterium]